MTNMSQYLKFALYMVYTNKFNKDFMFKDISKLFSFLVKWIKIKDIVFRLCNDQAL